MGGTDALGPAHATAPQAARSRHIFGRGTLGKHGEGRVSRIRVTACRVERDATPDTGLVRLLVRANAIRDQLLADRSLTFEDIAKSEGVVPSYATRLFRLTILAPDIVSAILSGSHPPELTARRLMDDTRLPLDWNDQRRRLGFASAH